MAQSVIHTSFGAGELSKNLYARVDLDKYHVGAALIRNMFVDYRGGASTRMGLEFIAMAKSQGRPRVINFSFSTTQTYVLEFGDLYLRIYSNGLPLAGAQGVISTISQANPGVVTSFAHGLVNGQTVILEGIVGMTELNDRTFFVANALANSFTLLRVLDSSPVDTTQYTTYISGGTWTVPYELVTPYAEADLPLLKFAQSADTMTLTHPNYPIQLLKRTDPSTFTLTPMVIGPTIDAPTGMTVTNANSPGNTFQCGYVVTAVSLDGKEESLPSLPDYGGSAQLGADKGEKLTWTGPAQDVSHYNIYKFGPTPQSNTGANRHTMNSVFGFIGQSVTTQFIDSNIAPDYSKQPPSYQDPFSPGQILGPITITAPGSGWNDNAPPLVTTTGGTDTKPAQLRACLNDTGGVAYVTILQPGSWSVAPTLVISGGAGSGATATIAGLGPFTGTYPGCVSYFQQRQCFAASNNDPQTIWTSQTGSVFNFDASLVPIDSDAITLSLASRQVNQIKSMISMPTGMILLTSGGAWLLSGGGQQLAMTPVDVAAQPQASTGANDVPPININNDVLYVQARGSTVRDLVFNFYVQSFFGTDRSALANHLFFGYTIQEWCYAEEPFRTIWAVRNDGQLLCLTYVPEQEVFAWSHSDTQGNFLSVCSVVEGIEDAVYVVVKRFVQGKWVNFIERLHSRNFYSNVEFAFCVDAGLTLPQEQPNSTLTISALTGMAIVVADSPIFTADDSGKVLRGLLGGKGILTYLSATSCQIEIIPDGQGNLGFPATPNDPLTPNQILAGQWVKAKPVTTVHGLDHLVGKTVTGLIDGRVVKDLVVGGDGNITFPDDVGPPVSYITIGLGFQAQLQTLYLDTGTPTIQGRRKLISQCTVIVDDSAGIKAGPTFDNLVEYVNPATAGGATSTIVTNPIPLVQSDDLIGNLPWDWTVHGQVCMQMDYPVPATILGIIPQVTVGDTGR